MDTIMFTPLICKAVIGQFEINGKLIFGAFATEDIKQGEIVEQCPVLMFNPDAVEKIEDTDCRLKDYWFDAGYSRKGADIPERELPLGLGAIYNHSDDPNIEHDYDGPFLIFEATRDIKKGEQLCHDYGDDYNYTFPNKYTTEIAEEEEIKYKLPDLEEQPRELESTI